MGDAAEKRGDDRPTLRCEAPAESEIRLSRFRWNDQVRGLAVDDLPPPERLEPRPTNDELEEELPVSSSPTMPVPASALERRPQVELPGGIVVHPRLESILARVFVDDDS